MDFVKIVKFIKKTLSKHVCYVPVMGACTPFLINMASLLILLLPPSSPRLCSRLLQSLSAFPQTSALHSFPVCALLITALHYISTVTL